jgi:hypothetical protein
VGCWAPWVGYLAVAAYYSTDITYALANVPVVGEGR